MVVNLGTNDVGAFNSQEWKDEVTGDKTVGAKSHPGIL